MVDIKKIHFNKPQLKAMALNARETYVAAGRGTGKTQGILAPHVHDCMQIMPRSCGLLLGNSYRKLLTDLIPPLILGWEKLGFIQDRDYTIGVSDIPKKKGWLDPYIAPEKKYRQFFLHSKYGSGARLASQDRRVTLNGTEVDWFAGDEAKLLNYMQYMDQIIPTLRGREDKFGHIPKHHSIWFTTDKHFTRKGSDWIMRMKQRVDHKLNNDILELQCWITKRRNEGADESELEKLEKTLHGAQCVAVAFIEASTLDNIHALGWNFIRRSKLTMTDAMFRIAILNEDNIRAEGDFYPNFDRDKHCYSGATNYDKIDGLELTLDKIRNIDSTFDTDVNTNEALEIAIDWGGMINCMVVCQDIKKTFKVIKAMHTKPPMTYRNLADDFCNYYRNHKKRQVYMYYDPSGNASRADSTLTHAQQFKAYLEEKKWTVHLMNEGQTNPHYSKKFLLWQLVMEGSDIRLPNFRINEDACGDLVKSIEDAPQKQGNKGEEKDKSSELRNSGVLPEHATHYSDALDIIMFDKYQHVLEDRVALTAGEL